MSDEQGLQDRPEERERPQRRTTKQWLLKYFLEGKFQFFLIVGLNV